MTGNEGDRLARVVEGRLGGRVTSLSRLTGGDVAESFRLGFEDGRTVFAKTRRAAPPGFFTTEAVGLAWLAEVGSVRIPEVLAVADPEGGPDDATAELPFLALQWVDEGARREDTDARLGRGLAAIHRAGSPSFGREDRATTGSRGLPNEPCATWVEFYATQRLLPLARIAAAGEALPATAIGGLESVARRLAEHDTGEQPARLHGDLWAGNRLVDSEGRAVLIDPAAHGGHREFDLAMMQLFGGFGEAAFAAYDDTYPLADGWHDRVALHQIAPLVVHAIKFGGAYVAAASAAIDRYA